jgi:hypothetical protein
MAESRYDVQLENGKWATGMTKSSAVNRAAFVSMSSNKPVNVRDSVTGKTTTLEVGRGSSSGKFMAALTRLSKGAGAIDGGRGRGARGTRGSASGGGGG